MSAHGRRTRLVMTSLIGLFLAAGCSSTAGGTAAAGSASTLKAQIAHAKAVIDRRYHDCAALRLSPSHCPFKVASTPDGKGGDLIAINLTQQTGDDCYRGEVFFFDADRFLASTRQLPPRSVAGVEGLHAAGTAAFTVTYGVSASANSTCAMNGSAGTDDYVYGWNGSRMYAKSGTPPKPPRVIVGA
jgi:outer membrane murein-binding lipoprotein Lpp